MFLQSPFFASGCRAKRGFSLVSAMYRGRFAPTPSGELHLGSLVAAVASYLDARAFDGEWILRIEDVDQHRSRPHFESLIKAELERHGLYWDGPVVRQSERVDLYRWALETLRQSGLVYECACSRAVLQRRGCPINGEGEFIYPGYCRTAQTGEKQPDFNPRSQVSVRLCVNDALISFEDRWAGNYAQSVAVSVGDFVLRRADGMYAYHLAVVVDDFNQNITHVVRGFDILPLTGRHIYLQRILGFTSPSYLHVPLVYSADGQKLSKSASAQAIREGSAPDNLRKALLHLGLVVPDEYAISCDEILLFATKLWRQRFSTNVSL